MLAVVAVAATVRGTLMGQRGRDRSERLKCFLSGLALRLGRSQVEIELAWSIISWGYFRTRHRSTGNPRVTHDVGAVSTGFLLALCGVGLIGEKEWTHCSRLR